MENFLASVERRAFRIAQLATGNEADAMDIVQDAMIRLVRKYHHKPAHEWHPLFFRILEHRILDWHRREKLRQRWFFWHKRQDDDDEDSDTLLDHASDDHDPGEHWVQQQLSEQLVALLQGLPLQQQQCFLLRCWEGLSVAEVAEAMGISEGSVKTHYFRARQKLQQVVDQHEQ